MVKKTTKEARDFKNDKDVESFSIYLDNGYFFRDLIRNDPEKAIACIHKIINLNHKGVLKDYPIHTAVEASQADVLKALIEKGAKLNVQNDKGQTPLMLAVGYKDKIAEMLIKAGADLNMRDKEGRTVLHYTHDTKKIEKLIKQGADLNIMAYNDGSVLHRAVKNGDIEQASLLIEMGAQAMAKRVSDSKAPIHLARTKDMAELLLQNGADIDDLDGYKKTALHQVVKEGYKKMVDFYLSKGAKVDTRDTSGQTPFETACIEGNADIAEKLLEKGADILHEDNEGRSILFFAGSQEVVDLLVKNKLDVNHLSYDGSTPLHYIRDPKVAEALIKNGADIEKKDDKGLTPLHLAIKERRYDMARLLIKNNADIIAAYDNQNLSPLDYAENRFERGKNVSDEEKKELEALIKEMRMYASPTLLKLHDFGLAQNEADTGALKALKGHSSEITTEKEIQNIPAVAKDKELA